jgi:hypothetical protein
MSQALPGSGTGASVIDVMEYSISGDWIEK